MENCTKTHFVEEYFGIVMKKDDKWDENTLKIMDYIFLAL